MREPNACFSKSSLGKNGKTGLLPDPTPEPGRRNRPVETCLRLLETPESGHKSEKPDFETFEEKTEPLAPTLRSSSDRA
jgi:hypothetical protein